MFWFIKNVALIVYTMYISTAISGVLICELLCVCLLVSVSQLLIILDYTVSTAISWLIYNVFNNNNNNNVYIWFFAVGMYSLSISTFLYYPVEIIISIREVVLYAYLQLLKISSKIFISPIPIMLVQRKIHFCTLYYIYFV